MVINQVLEIDLFSLQEDLLCNKDCSVLKLCSAKKLTTMSSIQVSLVVTLHARVTDSWS